MEDVISHSPSGRSTSTGIVNYGQELLKSALALPVDARRDIVQSLIWSLPRDEVLTLNARLNTMLQKDIIGLLPPELAFSILSRLDLDDLLRCCSVSRTWNKLCNEQALWALLCASSQPPIKPAETTWADITRHRQLMQSSIRTNDDMSLEMDDGDYDDERERFGTFAGMGDMDTLSSQGGMGGGGGLDPLGMTGGLRRSVWERGGAGAGAGLPTHLQYPIVSTSISASTAPINMIEPIVPSHSAIPSAKPQPNYKHLFIVHNILTKRMTTPRPSDAAAVGYGSTCKSTSAIQSSVIRPLPRPRTIDAISSVKAGGLPGHSEAVYSLTLIHHPMRVTMLQACPDCHVQPSTSTYADKENHSVFDSLLTFTAVSPAPSSRRLGRNAPSITNPQARTMITVNGRDWLLSGSRDKTLRLWHIATPEPRVVKIFNGGHTGSVLTHCVVQVPMLRRTSVSSHPPGRSIMASPNKEEDERNVMVLAVSGGSDGKLCLWDVESTGSPEKVVQAHGDSVLCVRADDEHVVTCSKDKTIKLFDLRTLNELLVIGGSNDDPNSHRGAVNAVGLSKDFIVSASGDKTIRLWSIHDGSLMTCIEAHHRGIASIDFSLDPGPHIEAELKPGYKFRGTIVTGSSDASMKMFDILEVPVDALRGRMRLDTQRQSDGEGEGDDLDGFDGDLSFREMLDMDTDLVDLNLNDSGLSDPFSGREGDTRLLLRQTARSWALCVCPPGLTRPEGIRCGRCYNRGHTDLVRSVFLGEGVIVSGSYDSSVKIWDRSSARLIADLTGYQKGRGRGRIFSVVSDKVRVISSGLDCKINIWDFSEGLDTSFVQP